MEDTILANYFVMCECIMKPMARFGLNTHEMHVYGPGNRGLIGYYDPNTKNMRLVAGWHFTFGVVLIKELGLKHRLAAKH